jgi:NADP-dependent 3-hydroxy acid dehydrogenase YdfG
MAASIALVAGASGDIGHAITAGLVRAGMTVLALGRSRQRLTQIAKEQAGKARPIVADLRSKSDVQTVRGELELIGRLDVLVLSSGIYERSRDPDSLARQFASNVQGPNMLLTAALPYLIKARGLVVFINSRQGLFASREVGHYAATQHAVRALADSLREEVNSKGVRVTSVYLGRTATTRQAAIFEMERRPYSPEKLIQPADVATLVTNLATLHRTAEVTDVMVRPSIKSY